MSRLYLSMARRSLAALVHRVWHRGIMRSGMVTGLIIAVLAGGLGFAYRERGRGNIRKLKARIEPVRQDAPEPRPGGRAALVLTRLRMVDSSSPQFLSVTMLPGRGMNVFQIVAFIPGEGVVKLMDSPTVDSAAAAMTGTGADANGQQSLAMGGAFEVPWAGRIGGGATHGARHASALWNGHVISLAGNPQAGVQTGVQGGLMLAAASASTTTTAFPDGGQVQAVFHERNFGGHWPSKTDVTVTVLLGGKSIEMTVVARNVGDTAEPVGIGWHPRFAIFDGNREQMRLYLPCQQRVEMRDGAPSGTLLPVAGTAYDFTEHGGVALGEMNLDDTFVAPPGREPLDSGLLDSGPMDSGPMAELSDPANDYGLRLTALSPTIKAFRVVAPTDADYVSISPQYNYDDPFGKQWGANSDTGMVVLQPGQSTQWKVRLDLYALGGRRAPL